MKHKEGIIVSCISKIKVENPEMKTGTIWIALKDRYLVLDKDGYIHDCGAHEVFEEQE